MSKSRHRQRTAYQWNPPPLAPHTDTAFDRSQNVVSATECTGLEAQPVLNRSAAVDYTDLYEIHEQKPQGNIGKDNPNNDPSEIRFHRQ